MRLRARELETLVGLNTLLDSAHEHVTLLLDLRSTALESVDESVGEGVDYHLDLTEDSGDWGTDEWNGGEKTSLADENVEESLVDLDEVAESVEDGV